MRERKPRHQRQRAAGGAQPLFAPGDRCQPKMMPPVIRFQCNRPPAGRYRVGALADAFEDEPQRAPRFGELGIETARLVGVRGRESQRVDIGLFVRARHLELEDARIGETDVRGRDIGRARHHLRKHVPGAENLLAPERLESGAAVE